MERAETEPDGHLILHLAIQQQSRADMVAIGICHTLPQTGLGHGDIQAVMGLGLHLLLGNHITISVHNFHLDAHKFAVDAENIQANPSLGIRCRKNALCAVLHQIKMGLFCLNKDNIPV